MIDRGKMNKLRLKNQYLTVVKEKCLIKISKNTFLRKMSQISDCDNFEKMN